MSFKLNRRNFLQSATGGVLGAAASGISLKSISSINAALANEQVRVPGGPEAWALSTCSLCPAGCGLRVRTVGGRAVKITGNPLHPVNHGGMCPKGMAGLQALYHPDRLRSPMKNTGTKEAPQWRAIQWEEATATLTAGLRRLRAANQAHTAVLIDRSDRNLQGRLLRRFMNAYGSPNYLAMPSGLDSTQAAVYFQQGVTQPVAYDLDRTRYLLSFGVNLLEGWGSPTAVMRAFGHWRDAAAGPRAKFVQIEPRLSLTAAKADEWVALRPGTEAALAMGIAFVLISEGIYDANFVREHTFGFEDWKDAEGKQHSGFRSLVMSEYRLDDVAAITGVPAETILRLGREFGRNRPALALGDHQTSALSGNPYAAMAVHSLNALVGNIDSPGGSLIQHELPMPPEDEPLKIAAARIDEPASQPLPGYHVGHLPEAIRSGKPYAVQALILNEVDPVFALPNGAAFREALAKVPFVVSFASFLDDTSAMAELVLPAPTDLERWQESSTPPAFPYTMQSIAPPVMSSRHGVRQPAEVLLEVARGLGDPVSSRLPYANIEEYLKSQVAVLFKAKEGAVFSHTLEDTWNRLLERSGWWAPTYSSEDELWEQIKQKGGWWEPSYYYGEWERVFRTPSGRFEFYSQTLAQWAGKHAGYSANGLKAGDDRLYLPHQPPLAEEPAGYPYQLLPVEVLPLAGGHGAHLPYLQQIAAPHVFNQWDSWLEINPETAAKLGIGEGDMVWVESRRGKARVTARLYQGVRPGTVHLPLGYGHAAGSDWACRGTNPLSLVEEGQTFGTYVKVYRS